MLAQPTVHDIGVDAIGQGHDGHGRSGLVAILGGLGLDLWAVNASLGPIGLSFARHGVHDLHRAHYLLNAASPQGVLPGRWALTSGSQEYYLRS